MNDERMDSNEPHVLLMNRFKCLMIQMKHLVIHLKHSFENNESKYLYSSMFKMNNERNEQCISF